MWLIGHAGRVRVAIITESFLPHMNGVTRSVCEVARHLVATGHEALVIAPRASGMPTQIHGAPVVGVPSVALPGYAEVRVAAGGAGRVERLLAGFAPDVVHLASPFALGWRGAVAADRLGVASVGVYQTDVAAFSRHYAVGATAAAAEAHIARLHRRTTLTLVPSSASHEQLRALGVDRLRRWGRGVDTAAFGPRHRSDEWRRWIAPGGQSVVGYVGRLAAEKQVGDLRVLTSLPDVRLVIIGDGPERAALEAALPGAVFLGRLDGLELSTAIASLDVLVHPGESETFGQTLQEAHASGVPVVATGRGGPLDLVRSSIDGWLYRPGDLGDLRDRVVDLVGDVRKRRAFGEAGRRAVVERGWDRVCARLLDHMDEARELRAVDSSSRGARRMRAEPIGPVEALLPPRDRPLRLVALGDSITEGMGDSNPGGGLRGWVDRLAVMLAASHPVDFANLAVRSRRVEEMCREQLPMALALRPDLVTILIGANDLVAPRADIAALTAGVERCVAALRATGARVVLVTPFLPGHRAATIVLARRFARFADALIGVARRTGAVLVDTDLIRDLADARHWGVDGVHPNAAGHRALAYRAAFVLGVPHSDELSMLDARLHEEQPGLRFGPDLRQAAAWATRRIRGERAGDGRSAKHSAYERLGERNSRVQG